MSLLPAGLWREDEMLFLRWGGWTCLPHNPQHIMSASSPRVWQDRWSGRPTVEQPQAHASFKAKFKCCSVRGASVITPTLLYNHLSSLHIYTRSNDSTTDGVRGRGPRE